MFIYFVVQQIFGSLGRRTGKMYVLRELGHIETINTVQIFSDTWFLLASAKINDEMFLNVWSTFLYFNCDWTKSSFLKHHDNSFRYRWGARWQEIWKPLWVTVNGTGATTLVEREKGLCKIHWCTFSWRKSRWSRNF